mgnify:CR=1 FL=1
MNFSEVIGQEAVKERLIQMVKEDRLPHALLFCGPQGCLLYTSDAADE